MFTLKAYHPDQQSTAHEFFILNKGLNSGKPLQAPVANCFRCSCSSAEEKEKLFWLCWGLWKCKHWEQFLCGSVIPFIRKHDLCSQLQLRYASNDCSKFLKAVNTVCELQSKEEILKQQLQLIAQCKIAILRQHIK
ncbi:MAG: hypothetical protein EKK37_17290 [Sphingobacteriales bacterium]|nr:MAG: hypothetical protein EKK37_17290 [Sphingobacteriales bacterium]